VKNKGVGVCVKKRSLMGNHGERRNYEGDDSCSVEASDKKMRRQLGGGEEKKKLLVLLEEITQFLI
jgi:hypothetical protein